MLWPRVECFDPKGGSRTRLQSSLRCSINHWGNASTAWFNLLGGILIWFFGHGFTYQNDRQEHNTKARAHGWEQGKWKATNKLISVQLKTSTIGRWHWGSRIRLLKDLRPFHPSPCHPRQKKEKKNKLISVDIKNK